MPLTLSPNDRFGLVRPAVDAHTLGLDGLAQLLQECGYQSVTADAAVCAAFDQPDDPACAERLERWLRAQGITVLGFSFRLDPKAGAELVGRLVRQLKNRNLLAARGGPLKAFFFAGLPPTCALIQTSIPEVDAVFRGDETPAETLRRLGLDAGRLPRSLSAGLAYDEARLAFGRDLIASGRHREFAAPDRHDSPGFGTRSDTLAARVRHAAQRQLPPLMRAHVGPYLPDRAEAVKLFLDWTRQLATAGFLDVLSIGTSQLTQSSFGEDWGTQPNGGGVPLNSPAELGAVWEAARPMLVRTYAGTRNVPALARVHEQQLNIAWHALSFWWFCQIDGRGPHTVRENLEEHFETLRYIATTGKPFEPNIPHHFAFRGADDVTYVVSAVLAARAAHALGIRYFILQNMLNTPKYTWGVQDLAKSRALLALVRELEDENFQVILQPRGGLDYFSPDLEQAKVQLAAVTALMDDIEPHEAGSPQVIHVVSYSEASHLADPAVVNESIQITQQALRQYRALRAKGQVDDMSRHPEVATRTAELLAEARTLLQAIEAHVARPYTPQGLYEIFRSGFLPVPYLWECREEFKKAAAWQTRLLHGSVKVVDAAGKPLSAAERVARIRL